MLPVALGPKEGNEGKVRFLIIHLSRGRVGEEEGRRWREKEQRKEIRTEGKK